MNNEIFEKLSPEKQKEIEKTVFTSPIGAINKLREFTGCSISEGKMNINELREKSGKKIFLLVLTAAKNCERLLPNNAVFANETGTMKTN